MPQQTAPVAFEAPARAQPGGEQIPSSRLHAQGRGITVRTAISLRQDEIEKHRRSNPAEHEEASEHEDKDHCIGHILFLPLEKTSGPACSPHAYGMPTLF